MEKRRQGRAERHAGWGAAVERMRFEAQGLLKLGGDGNYNY